MVRFSVSGGSFCLGIETKTVIVYTMEAEQPPAVQCRPGGGVGTPDAAILSHRWSANGLDMRDGQGKVASQIRHEQTLPGAMSRSRSSLYPKEVVAA